MTASRSRTQLSQGANLPTAWLLCDPGASARCAAAIAAQWSGSPIPSRGGASQFSFGKQGRRQRQERGGAGHGEVPCTVPSGTVETRTSWGEEGQEMIQGFF